MINTIHKQGVRFLAALGIALSLTVFASAQTTTTSTSSSMASSQDAMMSGDIVETAMKAGMFNTLAKALMAAELVDTLKGSGPFTVFAPTDAAFAKIPADTLNALMMPENKDLLKSILLYHVVKDKVPATAVMSMKTGTTAQGGMVKIKSKNNMVMVDKAMVTKTDIMASNGIIHVIDTVLMPKDSAKMLKMRQKMMMDKDKNMKMKDSTMK